MSNFSYKSEFSGYREQAMKTSARPLSCEEQLYIAIDRGDARRVKYLMKKGANVNATHPTGRTPLGFAAYIGNVEILKMLLEPLKEFSPEDYKATFEIDHVQNDHDSKVKCSSGSSKGKACCGIATDKSIKTCSDSKAETSCSKLTPRTNCRRGSQSSEDETSQEADKTLKYHKRCRGGEAKGSLNFDHCDTFSGLQLPPGSPQNQTVSLPLVEKNKKISEGKTEINQGYFIVVHNDNSSEDKILEDECEKNGCDENVSELLTPDGMDNLEWDLELQFDVCDSPVEERQPSESWVDLYRYYADYLAETCGVDRSRQCSGSIHIDVNQLDMYRRSALHYAAETGNMEVLHTLLSAGGSVDIGDSDDVTPLHLAAARNHPEAVALLLSCGAKVNRKSIDGTGPLHMAAARGFIETACILLEHGACVNALDRSDRTPLHLAVTRGLEDMVKLLISRGAKVNMEDILGYTPLCQAVWQQEKEIVKLLLSAGAKLTHSDRLLHCAILHRCPDIAELLILAGSIVNLRDDSGDTPLIIAARSGQTDVVKMLLQNGAMASYPNGLTGSTPLHEAVECLRPSQHSELKETILSLLSYKGPSGLLNVESSSTFDVPLVRALVHNRDHAVILLIQLGADIKILQKHTPIVSEEYLLKRPNRLVIAQLMIFAGLNLWDCTENIKYGVMYQDDTPAAWIASMKFNPMSLCGLSRLKLRSYHGENIFNAVSRFGLPKQLVKYIMLEDIVSVDNYLCSCK